MVIVVLGNHFCKSGKEKISESWVLLLCRRSMILGLNNFISESSNNIGAKASNKQSAKVGERTGWLQLKYGSKCSWIAQGY